MVPSPCTFTLTALLLFQQLLLRQLPCCKRAIYTNTKGLGVIISGQTCPCQRLLTVLRLILPFTREEYAFIMSFTDSVVLS